MTPAFGFSVGDFISAIGLVNRVSKALKDVGGASAEYQLVIIELNGLKNILRHLETLEPTEDNVTHINAIRGMALACQLPLRDFMVKLEKYESTLGPFADKRSLRTMVKKSKWAVVFADEVERLRAMVAAKNISLNLLLAMNISQTLSRMDSRDKEKHSDLMSKVAEHRATLHKVRDGILQVDEKVSGARAAFDQRFDGIENNMTLARETSSRRFDEIGARVKDTQTSVMSLRSTGEQILRCLGTFPKEMRELLQKIVCANWQMYQVLLKIQQSTARSPTGLLESNIRFEDALGDYRELPYEFFRHWEPFEGFLRAQFKEKLGERKVLEGQYHIIDVGNGRTIVNKEHWSRSIEQGATLTMSMVMSHLQRRAESCPRPSCSGGGVKHCPVSGLLSCEKCNLKFYPISNDFEQSSSRLEEENIVARRQYEEDLRLYGSRLEPMDDIEVDVQTELAISPTKDILTDLETTFDDTEKVHKIESNTENDEASTYTDTNAGATPLSAWLTQSALPSVIPMRSHPLDQSPGTEVDLVKEEIREIEVFRYVHLASDPEIGAHAVDTTKVEDVSDLKLPSQIYYRNIVDRYPLLPTYLARRLAEANSNRADRLSRQRVEATAKATGEAIKSGLHKAPRPARPGASPVYGSSASEKETQERTREPLVRSGIQAKQKKALNQHRSISPDYVTRTREPSHDKRPKARRKRASSYATLSKNQPQYDYWSGGSPRYRTKSVGSRSSSRNSSLHGSPKFCYQKQYQNIWNFASEPNYYQYSSPSLPPPPVKLRTSQPSKRKAKKLSFDCDICGEKVKVDRRRQWQKHVMRDLRPYVCTARECDHATKSFPSLNRYLTHEIEAHEMYPLERSSDQTIKSKKQESIVCIFCGDHTEAGKGDDARGRHVGRHMEEIAFTVVPKAYEEWEFYSESSSANSHSYVQTKTAGVNRKTSTTGANQTLAGKAGMPSREATAKDAKKYDIPTGYSLKHWDPEEEPLLLLGSVFDANSLGKWIYDWTAFCHGAVTPMSDIAGELWLLMIQLAGKQKRIEEGLSLLTNSEDKELLEDFCLSAERLWGKLKNLLRACEEYMWKPVKKDREVKMGKESGREFVDTMFGRDRKLEATETLMQGMRLWIMRYEANCEDILKAARSREDRHSDLAK